MRDESLQGANISLYLFFAIDTFPSDGEFQAALVYFDQRKSSSYLSLNVGGQFSHTTRVALSNSLL